MDCPWGPGQIDGRCAFPIRLVGARKATSCSQLPVNVQIEKDPYFPLRRAMMSMTAPVVMAASATLKAGQ